MANLFDSINLSYLHKRMKKTENKPTYLLIRLPDCVPEDDLDYDAVYSKYVNGKFEMEFSRAEQNTYYTTCQAEPDLIISHLKNMFGNDKFILSKLCYTF